jgi:hypothetical protein
MKYVHELMIDPILNLSVCWSRYKCASEDARQMCREYVRACWIECQLGLIKESKDMVGRRLPSLLKKTLLIPRPGKG